MQNIFKIYKKQIIGSALLALFALGAVLGLGIFRAYHHPDMVISFFDVGQGDSIFIEAKDGTQILIDGGPPNRILPLLGGAMSYFDRYIDVVVLTHPHADHVSGLLEILERYDIGEIIESGADYNTAEAKEFENLIKKKNIKRVIIGHPTDLVFFEGAVLRFIYPDRLFEGEILKNVHDSALVAELDFEGKKILFMADAEKKLEKKLVEENKISDVDVLKIGHHGSKTSSNDFFLAVAKPEYAVISVGARNRYGHPTQQTLSNLASVGAKIFRTDLDGTIKLKIDNGNLEIVSGK